ncbi:hypothetical protein C8R44DRAFT_787016, partial [Mycena epipterygia]
MDAVVCNYEQQRRWRLTNGRAAPKWMDAVVGNRARQRRWWVTAKTNGTRWWVTAQRYDGG